LTTDKLYMRDTSISNRVNVKGRPMKIRGLEKEVNSGYPDKIKFDIAHEKSKWIPHYQIQGKGWGTDPLRARKREAINS